MIPLRQEIKESAKSAMKAQWGTSIGTLLFIMLVSMIIGLVVRPFILTNPHSFGALFVNMLNMLLVNLATALVVMPLSVNANGIFIKVFLCEPARVGELLSNFQFNYLRKIGGMLWMGLLTLLWSLLLVIPGIVKGLSYSMTPYILADCPNVTATEALKLSMRMTDGHKMELFILGLSFIGWFLLSTFTFGILAIVFVNPYIATSLAGYYVELKQKALATGVISYAELI